MENTKEEEINKKRHSLAHILAWAVKEMYPEAKLGIGPVIENGFYYDFDFGKKKISVEDLPKIEQKMKEILKKEFNFKKKIISGDEALKLFAEEPYKKELAEELIKEKKEISIYKSGDFTDLCAGPHIESSKEINPKSFKLIKVAGAYWKGKEENEMLTRIYGVAFETEKELEEYLNFLEEAAKRDHRVLGKRLKLFIIDEEVGSGLPLWLPKGAKLRKIIQDYLYSELNSQEYEWVSTPHIGRLNLWKISGHWNHYRENMYSPIKIDEEEYMIKPMNCPFHVKIYKSETRSYRDLPIKYAEFGTVYRYERSGTLHGLTRVRGFTQDDAHIWCSSEQLTEELTKLVKYGLNILKKFGFEDFNIYLSTRPEKYAGTDEGWEKATNSLKEVLALLGLNYEIDPGGGVFYGPKIDIKIKDSLGREWQCTTIQVDFNLPEKFDINFINKDGEKERPFMIHRALLGSLERFIGVLIEHYAGAFPFWLSPTQVWVLPISSNHKEYGEKIAEKLKENKIRVELRQEAETIGKKIREGEMQKIPYLLIVGEKEIKENNISVRERGKGDIGSMSIDEFLKKISS